MNMNISCRIANADTQCGRITNPPEREIYKHTKQNTGNLNSMFILSLVISIVTFAATSCLNNNHKVESGDNTLYGHIAAIYDNREDIKNEKNPMDYLSCIIYYVIANTNDKKILLAFNTGYMIDSIPFFTMRNKEGTSVIVPRASSSNNHVELGQGDSIVVEFGLYPIQIEEMGVRSLEELDSFLLSKLLIEYIPDTFNCINDQCNKVVQVENMNPRQIHTFKVPVN